MFQCDSCAAIERWDTSLVAFDIEASGRLGVFLSELSAGDSMCSIEELRSEVLAYFIVRNSSPFWLQLNERAWYILS